MSAATAVRFVASPAQDQEGTYVSRTHQPTDPSDSASSSVTPVGKLGFRGRAATPEERARVLDTFFFEGQRRRPYLEQFFVLMVLSAAIAGFGLANDSAAVVIGAMLVAPLMTPILATAAATVQGWGQRVVESLAIVVGGALAAIVVGLVIGLLILTLRTGLPLPGEILARTGPNLIDLGIALAAGAAGGFVAVRSEASGALPGVGIAVALVPPLATVGITASLGEWDLAFGALLLFGTNLVAIIFAAGLVLVAAGFAAFRGVTDQRQASIARAVVIVALVIVAIPLLAHSWQRLEERSSTAVAVEGVTEWAPELTLAGISLERSADPILVRVAVTGDEPLPDPLGLARLLAADFGRAVDVDVVFEPVASASAPDPSD
jgi:uncharacterized hydrophobic protein (TIGR00271 family)